MRLSLPVVVMVLSSLSAAAQEPASADALYQRALALHDSGDYNGAIAIYKELLKTAPDNETVRYELTYSTLAKGDTAETIRLATEGARRPGPTQVRYLELLGNAYDAEHRPMEAVEAFKRGIKADPSYAPIHLNLGITYGRQNKLKDAREAFENAIAADPRYASPQLMIASVYQADGYRVPAILAFGRFLSLERTTARAAIAAKNLHELVAGSVQGATPGNLQILINPDAKKDLGDFTSLELALSIVVAGGQLKEKDTAPKSEAERAADALAMFMSMLAERADDYKSGYIGKTYVPFYAALVKAGHHSAFAHLTLSPLKLTGSNEWLSTHQADVGALNQWLRTYDGK